MESSVDRYRLLVLSRCLPYEGINHAGGEYVRRSIASVSAYADVTVVAMRSARNEYALSAPRSDYRAVLVSYRGIHAGRLADLLRRVAGRLEPLGAPLGLANAIRSDAELRRVVRSADVIEVQWTEMLPVLKAIDSQVGSCARTVLVAHDVLAQRFQRMVRGRGPLRWLRQLRYRLVVRRERELVERADAVVVFSDKDAVLLQDLGVTTPTTVIAPPLSDALMGEGRRPRPGLVVFVGAFSRRENQDGADWLLREIWPQVRCVMPTARLVLAGSDSDSYLTRVDIALRDGVSATGYVESLDPYYRNAAVAVVPMRLGAGVKFKTITAMLWGVPVVASFAGVEGLAPEPLYAGVTNDGTEFARLVVAALKDPKAAERGALRAQEWARSHLDSQQFSSAILSVHRGLGS